MTYTYEQHKNLIKRHDNEQQINRIEMENMYNYQIPISILKQYSFSIQTHKGHTCIFNCAYCKQKISEVVTCLQTKFTIDLDHHIK
jgi:hypothetical protein